MNTDYQTSLIQEEKQTAGQITMAAPADTSGQTGGGMNASKADFSSVSFLADMNEMMIKQPVRGKELFFEQCLGCEMSNYYEAEKVTEDGNKKTIEKLFVMHEESNCCLRQWYIYVYILVISMDFHLGVSNPASDVVPYILPPIKLAAERSDHWCSMLCSRNRTQSLSQCFRF